MARGFKGNILCYTFILALNIGLVWLLPYFPTQDGPSHVYNLVILHDLLNGGKDWGSFYTYKLQATPNLGFHFLAYPLLYFFPPLIVEKLFITFYILLMGVSVPVFLKTFSDKVFPFAYFVFPVLFNFCFMMGFYSYVITVPLFLLALSLSWRIRNYSVPYKILYFNLMGITLFYFHLIPAVLYLISLATIAVTEPASCKGKISNMAKLPVVMAPWILNFLYYMWWNSFLAGHSTASHHVSQIDLLRDFFSFSTVSFGSLQEVVWTVLLFFFLFFFSVYLFNTAKDLYQARIKLTVVPAQEKFLFCYSTALVVLYFLAPFNFGEGSFFNQRFPWVIFLIVLPLLRFPERVISQRLCSVVTAGIAVLFIVFNAKILWQQSTIVKNFTSGLQAPLPKGAFIMCYKNKNSGSSRADVLMHAASYYAIDKRCVYIGNYEAGITLFPVRFKSGLPLLPSQDQVIYDPETIQWEKYPRIDYVIGWKIDEGSRRKLERSFYPILENESISIWCRNITVS